MNIICRNIINCCSIIVRGLVRGPSAGHPKTGAVMLQAQQMTGWKPAVVTPTSEALYDFQKSEIERAWPGAGAGSLWTQGA